MCYLFRIRGLALPPVLVKTPGELFGIMLLFVSYDAWNTSDTASVPLPPGLWDEDQIQRSPDGYHPQDGFVANKWNISVNVTDCTVYTALSQQNCAGNPDIYCPPIPIT